GAIDVTKAGTYTGIVEVTYPDGTKETIEVPVVVTDVPDNMETTPVASTETMSEDGTYDLTDNVTSVPTGTTIKDVTPAGAVDVTKAGTYTGIVEVTYPDGTKETIEVPVVVTDVPDNTETTPVASTETISEDGTYDLTDNVTSVPSGTTIKDVTPIAAIDVTKAGTYTGIVEVTYPDGTKETIEVPVVVTDVPDNTETTPVATTETISEDGTYDLTDNVTSVPAGTTIKDVTPIGAIDVTKAGTYTGIVEVTYPDGTKETIEVPVVVTDVPDNAETTPVSLPETMSEDGPYDLTDNVTSVPAGTTIKDVTPAGAIDVTKAGKYTGIVEVTYPDGTKETIEVPVVVTDVPDNAETTPVSLPETMSEDGPYDLTDNVTSVPAGTTIKDVTPAGAIDVTKAGTYTGIVEVTYPDGTTERVEVPVTVTDVPDNT
ncbi:Rib/alpha-like domain-containing protein, partial [Macrococcoides caseolyticum]|uniref:Rib/alpha-like domain-containing protein n=1 Tax=Macrococcoides caseolyticum TaxID=69966 RepID=UPI0022783BAA